MRLVIIFLNKVDLLEDILAAFIEIGVSGATVIDSVGMGRILSYEVPVFAGLRDAFPGTSPVNKTILVVTEEEKLKKICRVIEDLCGSLETPGAGLIASIPLDFVQGYRPGL